MVSRYSITKPLRIVVLSKQPLVYQTRNLRQQVVESRLVRGSLPLPLHNQLQQLVEMSDFTEANGSMRASSMLRSDQSKRADGLMRNEAPSGKHQSVDCIVSAHLAMRSLDIVVQQERDLLDRGVGGGRSHDWRLAVGDSGGLGGVPLRYVRDNSHYTARQMSVFSSKTVECVRTGHGTEIKSEETASDVYGGSAVELLLNRHFCVIGGEQPVGTARHRRPTGGIDAPCMQGLRTSRGGTSQSVGVMRISG